MVKTALENFEEWINKQEDFCEFLDNISLIKHDSVIKEIRIRIGGKIIKFRDTLEKAET